MRKTKLKLVTATAAHEASRLTASLTSTGG